jgi:subtilisin family serine protease
MRWGGGALVALLLFASSLHAQRPVWVHYDGRTDANVLRAQLEASGARIRYTSRWINAISVDVPADRVSQLDRLAGVVRTQSVARVYGRRLGAASRSAASLQESFDSAFYGPNWRAIRNLGIPPAHTLGFTGRGIRIAILDTGFEPSHEALRDRIVTAQRDFIHGDANVANGPGDKTGELDQEVHGTAVWSLLGGRAPGRVVGPAYEASYILAKVEAVQPAGEEDFAADEDRWIAAVEWADSQGARIISSSLAFRTFVDKPDYPRDTFNGDIAMSTRIADEAARRGILVVNMVGNEGPGSSTVMAPADADSIIAVGGVDLTGQVLAASSRGPTADGRLKPELVAYGEGLQVASALATDAYTTSISGPDYAAPLVAGMAAMFMQAWPSLTASAARTALILSATRAQTPDNDVGFGIPNVASAIVFPEGLFARAITPGLGPGNTLTTLGPTFTWEAPLRHPAISALFRLEIASDPAFTNVVYADTIRDRTTLTMTRPLRPGSYFWRVVATAFPGITRITPVAGPFVMPDWVRLTTLNLPQNPPQSSTPTFTWQPLEASPPIGPLTFEVQVLNAQTGRVVQTINAGTNTSVTPTNALAPNITYNWRVIARTAPQIGMADTTAGGNFLVDTDEHPPATLLYQNFPNPFPRPELALSETQIWFDVTTRTEIDLAIYDLRGRLVKRLIPAEPSCGAVFLEPGQYGRGDDDSDACVLTRWDGRAQSGEQVGRGVYILRLRAGGTDQVKRIVYIPQ